MYHVSHWLANKFKNKNKTKQKRGHRTDFEADLWPETGDLFGLKKEETTSVIALFQKL